MKEQESQPTKETAAAPDRKSPCEVIYLVGEQSFKGISTQFSERGILILCKNPAPLNTKLQVKLQFPGFRNLIELNGEVVWTNIYGAGDSLSPKGMGVKFTNIERDVERLLSEIAAQYECQGSVYCCYYT
ncbi:MAG: PilZ domain-containing protein [Syntrophobacteraceae bacterium]